MFHIACATIYAVINIYYIIHHNVNFGQKLHGLICGCLLLYTLARHWVTVDDRPIFLTMHYTLYIAAGGKSYPVWILAFATWILVEQIIQKAEHRIFIMYSEVHRLIPAWGFDYVYTHTAQPRLNITSEKQRNINDTIIGFVQTRTNKEIPVAMNKEDKILWKLSDNKSLLLNRQQRSTLLTSIGCITFILYAMWWQTWSYYILIDTTLFITILFTNWQTQTVIYHTAFTLATFYLQSNIFRM